MNAVQEVLSPFLSTSKQKTKQTQTTELAHGAAPDNKKTQQQSWPTRPLQTKNNKDTGLRAGPPGRPKQKKETQQQSWPTRPPQSIIIVIVVVVAVEIVIILVIDSTNKRTSNNNE